MKHLDNLNFTSGFLSTFNIGADFIGDIYPSSLSRDEENLIRDQNKLCEDYRRSSEKLKEILFKHE